MKYLIGVLLSLLIQSGLSGRCRLQKVENFPERCGYEFKYPDCWEINIDSPDEEGPLNTIRDIFVSETSRCSIKQLANNRPNGIGLSGGAGPKEAQPEALREIKLAEKGASNNIRRGEWLVFKKFKLGNVDAIGWVTGSVASKGIGWSIKIYCPDWWISVVGPEIDRKNIDRSLYEKFKKGDLALPEPYKTIVNSIRCIPAKQKQDPWWVKKDGKWIYKPPSPTKK